MTIRREYEIQADNTGNPARTERLHRRGAKPQAKSSRPQAQNRERNRTYSANTAWQREHKKPCQNALPLDRAEQKKGQG